MPAFNTLRNYQERPLITSPGQTHFRQRHVAVILLMDLSVLGAGIGAESNTPTSQYTAHRQLGRESS